MSEGTKGGDAPRAVRAVVERKRGISLVWLIPFVAALLGAFLVYKAITERGPQVSITFRTADGLVADKTKIKYRNVEVRRV